MTDKDNLSPEDLDPSCEEPHVDARCVLNEGEVPPITLGLELDGCSLAMSMSQRIEDLFDCRCTLIPANSLKVPSIASISFLMTSSDIERLADYLAGHVGDLILNRPCDHRRFFPYGLGIDLKALSGDVVSETDGYFTLRVMLNVGIASETESQVYFGCEATVDVSAVLAFVSSLKQALAVLSTIELEEDSGSRRPAGGKGTLKARVEAAEALGQAGDPQLQRENWVRFAPDLEIGKYPVTVQEYARFVDEGGYEPNGFGAQWREAWRAGLENLLTNKDYFRIPWIKNGDMVRLMPVHWQEQLGHLNRPVVKVSWYEAWAYCLWLSNRDARSDYRLPTEAEWQRAAGGIAGTGRYPWGDEEPGEGDQARANYDQAGIRCPTPVGLFPTGAADWAEAGQLFDMAGNVSEWCSDKLAEKSGGPVRPLRGGSYLGNASSLAVSKQALEHAARWFGNVSFRVVRFRLSSTAVLSTS